MEHRQHDRSKIEFPIAFSGDHAGTRTVYNIGVDGCKIISEGVASTGDILNIQLSLPTIMPPVYGPCGDSTVDDGGRVRGGFPGHAGI
jgi:hypothetical protein